MEKQNITKKVEEKNELSSKERHNIILKLYKGLTDNLEELNKSNEKQEYVLLDSSREIAKTLYQSWAKIKPSI